MNLEGKAAMITGASRGLGRALARRLAQRGAHVVLVARSQDELERAAAEIRKNGGTAHVLPADISDKAAIHPLAGAAAALVGPIDVLVHNASLLGPTPLRLLLDTDCEDLAKVLETNVVGPFRLTKIVAGSMALRGEGTIVHVTSDASVAAYPRWGSYSISKAAFDHMARILSVELAELGVQVFSVDPGEMDTQMHRDAMPDADPALLGRPDDVAARVVAMIERGDIAGGARALAAGEREAP